MNILSEFEEGHLAYKENKNNPYEMNSQSWESWQAGYYSAMSEEFAGLGAEYHP